LATYSPDTLPVLATYSPDTLYSRDRGCEDPSLLFEVKRGHRAKQFGKRCTTDTAHRQHRVAPSYTAALNVLWLCNGRES